MQRQPGARNRSLLIVRLLRSNRILYHAIPLPRFATRLAQDSLVSLSSPRSFTRRAYCPLSCPANTNPDFTPPQDITCWTCSPLFSPRLARIEILVLQTRVLPPAILSALPGHQRLSYSRWSGSARPRVRLAHCRTAFFYVLSSQFSPVTLVLALFSRHMA